MDVLYVGKFYPDKLIKSLKEDSRNKAGGMSNHNFEMSIINGLCQQKDIVLHCFTLPEVYSFPYIIKDSILRQSRMIINLLIYILSDFVIYLS